MTIASPPARLSDEGSRLSSARVSAPMREFLTWVARCPRSYEDAMEAWQSHCPRFTVWEDALAADLIEIVTSHAGAIAAAQVQLTTHGRSAI